MSAICWRFWARGWCCISNRKGNGATSKRRPASQREFSLTIANVSVTNHAYSSHRAGEVHCNFAEHRTAPALNYETSGPVPVGTVIVPGSTQGDAGQQVLFSIDQGKTFSPQPTVPQRQANGTIKPIPAQPEAYSHIRFHYSAPLTVGEMRTVSFMVRVR